MNEVPSKNKTQGKKERLSISKSPASISATTTSPEKNQLVAGILKDEFQPISINQAPFNLNDKELQTNWTTGAQEVFCINAYQNGVTFSSHRGAGMFLEAINSFEQTPLQNQSTSLFNLRLKETKEFLLPLGKYFLYKEDPINQLEKQLISLKVQNRLKNSVIYFGLTNDPFHAFHKKFFLTMGCLDLLQKYRPKSLVVQTRSPMAIASAPALKSLGKIATVVIPIETTLESVVARFTPGQSSISERLLAAEGLRKQKIRVNISVAPILPYGDFYKDAKEFAQIMLDYSDNLTFGCLNDGTSECEKTLNKLPIAKKLNSAKEYKFTRPHSYRAVYTAAKNIAPEKLILPVNCKNMAKQLDLFVA